MQNSLLYLATYISDRNNLASDQRFIDEVCRPILLAGNRDGIAWIAKVAESEASLLADRNDPAAATDFRDRIRQRLRDAQEDDPTLSDLRRIGVVLGIGPEESLSEPDVRSEDPSNVRE